MRKIALIASLAVATAFPLPAALSAEAGDKPQFANVVDELLANSARYRRLTPDEALEQLRLGNQRFVSQQTIRRPLTTPERAALAAEQHPFVAVLGCADSRVPVEVVFDRLPGDVFTVRIAGNVATPEVIGSLEYAVAKLKTPLIVVLGHQQCGAVAAAIATDGGTLPGSIPSLVERIEPATANLDRGKPLPELFEEAKAANIEYQAKALLEQSDIIRDAVAAGRVKVVGGYFTIDDGLVALEEIPLAAKE